MKPNLNVNPPIENGRNPRFSPRISSLPARLLGLAALLWLSSCASPLAIQPGTPEAEVRQRLGAPTAEYPPDAANPGRRLEYSRYYFQKAYMVDFDSQDRAVKVTQARTDAGFNHVRKDVDTMATIRREFGTPLKVTSYGLVKLTAWEYPYKQDGEWNSIMSIYFDANGVVRRMESGPDPEHEPRDGHGHR